VVHRLAACQADQPTGDGTWRAGASSNLIRDAVRALARIVDDRSPGPNVVYTAEGTIIFSWHNGGWDVEVEVAEGTTEAWALERSTGRELSGTLEDFDVDIRAFIADLGRVA